MILCMTFYVPGIHSVAIKFSCSTLTFDLNTSWGLAGCMSSGSALERWERSSLPCWPRRSTLKFVEGRMQWTQRWAASTSSSQSLQRWVCCSPPLSASCVGSSPTWSWSEATVLLFTGSIWFWTAWPTKLPGSEQHLFGSCLAASGLFKEICDGVTGLDKVWFSINLWLVSVSVWYNIYINIYMIRCIYIIYII